MKVKKFSEIEYVRPDFDAILAEIAEYTEAIKKVKSAEELKKLYLAHEIGRATRLNSSHVF